MWLRYMHERGYEWDTTTCEKAAEHGHLECLRYAHERGCPWDARDWYLPQGVQIALERIRVPVSLSASSSMSWGTFCDLWYDPWYYYVPTCWLLAVRGELGCLRYAREVDIEGAEAYADVLDEYVRAWVDFVVHAILSQRKTADDRLELSARRFRELYKALDADRANAKTRARARATELLHEQAKSFDLQTE